MKPTKHILLLTALLLGSLTASAHDFEVDGIYYNVTSEENLTVAVTYRGDSYNEYYYDYSGDITIPYTVIYNGKNYNVTSIEDNTFINCFTLSSISIPESIKSIGSGAFWNCWDLTSITIPASVTNIGTWAFRICRNLATIIVAEGNPVYDSRNGCNAIIETSSNTLIVGGTNTIIPESVTSVGEVAFAERNGLIAIDIPKSVTNIGDLAFFDCPNLTSITIPTSVKNIGGSAFKDCISLTSITIPEGVTSIGGSAFQGCSSLTSIIIPTSVTSMEWPPAFEGCSNLTSIVVEEGNPVYDSRENCNAIIETSRDRLIATCPSTFIPKSVREIGLHAFCRSDFTFITIPENVTCIDQSAFLDCSNLASIILPEGVTSINWNAFSGCSGLSYIICKATTPPTIDSNAFDNVNKGIPVYVPSNSVASYQSAENWKEFTNIQPLGDDVKVLSDWTSDNHSNGSLSSKVYLFDALEGDVLTFDWEVSSESNYDWFIATLNGSEIIKESGESSGTYQYTFTSSGSQALIVKYTKDGSVNNGNDQAKVYNVVLTTSSAPMIASGTCGDNLTWRLTEEYELVIEGTGDMYDYGQDSAPWYEYCHMINKVALPDGMLSIGNWAFGDCSSLTSITIPESVTNIGEHAFSDCSGLTTLTIPESVTSIEGWAFLHCTGLTSITIPANVINIGYGILMGCNGLVSVVVEEGNPVYDSRYNCNAIIETSSNTLVGGCSITVIPDDITSIGNRAFCYCDFATISIPESVTKIEDYAFGRSYLTSITLPEGVTSIGIEAFVYCENLTAITIPSSVASIGTRAFNACYALTEVHISSIEAWCEISFSDFLSTPLSYAHNLYLNGELVTELVIPESVTSIGDYAFLYCHNLAAITCKATTPPAIGGTQTFDEVDNSIPVYVPAGSVEAYKAAEYWSEFTNILPIGEPEPATVTITINQYGSGTYSSEYALDFSEVKVLKAYVATGYNHLTGEVTLLRVRTAEAGTGLLVKGTPGVSYEVPILESTADHTLNMLVATLEKTKVNGHSDDGVYANYKYTVVKEQSPEPLFYQFADGASLSAGKAYLQIPVAWLPATGQRALRYRFDEGETTDIEDSEFIIQNSELIYDLMGRRVLSPKKGEVYIINNKKVVY